MNWIKFVEEHPGRITLPRIGRSVYSYGSNNELTNTITNWFRETERQTH